METDGFRRQGQAWFCTTGLPSDVTIRVGEMLFHLHKFPLISRSGILKSLVARAHNSQDEDTACIIDLQGVPGGAESFELVAKFCYGVNVELTPTNVAPLRCAAEYLQMTEDYVEKNLISTTQAFLDHAITARRWQDTVKVLQSCESLMPYAEELQILAPCVDSLATKACTDPGLFGWPINMDQHGLSPGTTNILFSQMGGKLHNSKFECWFEDLALLSLPFFKLVIISMKEKGLPSETLACALMHYAKKSIPGLNRRQDINNFRVHMNNLPAALSERDQRHALEILEALLPSERGAASTAFLLALLKTASILSASCECKSNLEKRIGAQLEEAAVDDLLIPNYSYTLETLYDIDCVQRILQHFLATFEMPDRMESPASFEEPLIESPSSTAMTAVAKLVDGYLQEVASDSNLKPARFECLARVLPEYARVTDDNLYRAIDIYVKAHTWLTEQEKEMICNIMNSHKLSLEACSHAAQNSRLPLRVVVQVLFVEQLQLRSAISGCLFASDSIDFHRNQSQSHREGQSPTRALSVHHQPNLHADACRGQQILQKAEVDDMRLRVSELENQCSNMRVEIRRLRKTRGVGGSWSAIARKLGCKDTFLVCDPHEESAAANERRRNPTLDCGSNIDL